MRLKKSILTLTLTFFSFALNAQIERIFINIKGGYEIILKVGEGRVAVTDLGELVNIDLPGQYKYYDDFWSYQADKVRSVGNVKFSYYDDFWGYQAGKVKSIGSLNFSYNDNFWSYQTGKLKSAGGARISYNDNFWKSQTGKVKNIGPVKLEYYNNSDPFSGGNKQLDGLLKSVNGQQIVYNTMGNQKPSGGAFGERKRPEDGPYVQGRRQFDVDGIAVIVIDGRERHWR